jgi:murein DD-endopeptidase MepM/ murein hydrolase activator NlpD
MTKQIHFESFQFHPVIHLPDQYEIRDFTNLATAQRPPKLAYSVGRYDENRVGMYVHDLFEGKRTIHIGLDIGAPIHTPVHCFWDGVIYNFGYNSSAGDYGHVIITQHLLDGVALWALYGHLSSASLTGIVEGQIISKGDIIGRIGSEGENGGWPPHLHFQLSYKRPTTHDLPGVVSPLERAQALRDYPDPRLVLGPLY